LQVWRLKFECAVGAIGFDAGIMPVLPPGLEAQ